MSDRKSHPEDTADRHVADAASALVRARPTNRYYIFPMRDRVEIAFGNSRHVVLSEESGVLPDGSFAMEFHSAISMDREMLKDFTDTLGILLKNLEDADGR